MKEIIVFEYVDEFSTTFSGLFTVNVFKLVEKQDSETEDNDELKNINYINKDDEIYVLNIGKENFKKIFIGIGKYNSLKNKLIY